MESDISGVVGDFKGRRRRLKINYLKPRKRVERPRKQEYEGLYRCNKCWLVFYSDIRYKQHDCYESKDKERLQ
jgi:hypothetical protein